MPFRQVSRMEVQEPLSQLWNLEYPKDLRSPAEIGAFYHGIVEGSFEEHWVQEEDGILLAVLSAYDWHATKPPERITVDCCVDPVHSNPSAPLEFLEAIAGRAGAKSICLWIGDRNSARIDSLEKRGYRVIQTLPVTRLGIQAFDATPFQSRIDSVRQANLRMTTIHQLDQEGFDWIPSLYDATWEMLQDMPQVHPPRQMPLDQYRQLFTHRTELDRQLMFVVLDGDRIVSYSRLEEAQLMPGLVRTGISGTVRSHRRRGLVSVLKAISIQLMKERGLSLLQTDNDVTNPMYKLNLQLGFKDCWKWLQYERGL